MGNKTVKLLLYCTVAKPYLARNVFNSNDKGYGLYSFKPIQYGKDISLNGKIVAAAECDLVEKEEYSYACDDYATFDDDRLEATCLSRNQLNEYGKYRSLYLSHLKNVKPFEAPKELSEYFKIDKYEKGRIPLITGNLEKSAQNMCYAMDEDQQLYVVIFIRAEWLCKILNREKSIEIRTSILNLLKELMRNGK